jgi:predicted Rossmann-fold nucleotide-binding protein
MAIAERGVGCSELPVLLLNTDGYYDGSIRQLTRAYDDGMLRKHWTKYVDVVTTPKEAVEWCLKQKRRPHEPAPATPSVVQAISSPYARGLLHGAATVALLALWLVHRK